MNRDAALWRNLAHKVLERRLIYHASASSATTSPMLIVGRMCTFSVVPELRNSNYSRTLAHTLSGQWKLLGFHGRHCYCVCQSLLLIPPKEGFIVFAEGAILWLLPPVCRRSNSLALTARVQGGVQGDGGYECFSLSQTC